MSATYTPGPWTADYNNEHCSSVCRINSKGVEHGNIATVYCADPTIEDEREQAANARLIAAAPDLLAALSGAIEMIGVRLITDVFGYEWYEEAAAAIAKATGDRP